MVIAVDCRGRCYGSRGVVSAMGGHGVPRLAVSTRDMPVATRGMPVAARAKQFGIYTRLVDETGVTRGGTRHSPIPIRETLSRPH